MCRDRVILVMIIHGCYLYLFIILYFKYISFYFLKVFHHGHLLLLDIVKHDIKNSHKRKCLCENYKPKIHVSFDETDYSWTASSQRVTEEL